MEERQIGNGDRLGEQLWERYGEEYRARLGALIARRPITEQEETKAAREAVAAWYRGEIAAALEQPGDRVEGWSTPTRALLLADPGASGPAPRLFLPLDVAPPG